MAPEPGDGVVDVCCYQKAFGVEVRSVDKDLFVDAMWVDWGGWLDIPVGGEASLQCGNANAVQLGDAG